MIFAGVSNIRVIPRLPGKTKQIQLFQIFFSSYQIAYVFFLQSPQMAIIHAEAWPAGLYVHPRRAHHCTGGTSPLLTFPPAAWDHALCHHPAFLMTCLLMVLPRLVWPLLSRRASLDRDQSRVAGGRSKMGHSCFANALLPPTSPPSQSSVFISWQKSQVKPAPACGSSLGTIALKE